MKTFVGKILFFSIITAKGVMSEDVERLSDASIIKAIDENVTIVWNIKGITASVRIPLPILISKGELSESGDNIVLQFNLGGADSSPKAVDLGPSAHEELASRSTVNYTNTGNATARFSFTINNVILNDEGSYILTAKVSSLPTNLSVNYAPKKCGSGLQSEYIVNPGDQLNITSGFCGKPQPMVTCTFDGTPLSNVIIAEVSPYNYTYTVDIPKLKPCDRKKLRCTIAGYGKPFVDSAFFLRQFSSNFTSFIKNITFIQECQCQTVTWENNMNTGKCDVRYQLQFFNETNAATTPAKLERNSYRNCSVKSENVRISTFVYGNVSGTYKLLGNRTSDTVQVNVTPCTTTTTTTTEATATATTISSARTSDTSTVPTTKSQPTGDEEESSPIAAIVAGVGGALVVILVLVILIFCCMKKKNKGKATAIPLQEVAADNNAPQDLEGMYAQVDRSNRNQPTSNVSDLYAQVDKKNKSKKEPPSEYAQVDKRNKPKPQAAAPDNDYAQLDELAEPQGATAMPPQDMSSMYAAVNKNKDPPKEHTIYSELGPGGGRVGPKPIVQPSHYAEAKDFAPQYSAPARPPKGSYKASRNNTDERGHDNDGMGDDHEEMI